jgi:DNA-3-methyladenine glycosylase II
MILLQKMIPSYWQDALVYLTAQDAVMAQLIEAYPNQVLKTQGNPFVTLMRAVVGQQISIKVADAIWSRLESRIEMFSPAYFLTVEEDLLRECGLSRPKIRYLKAIALAFENQLLTPDCWDRMSDEEVIKQLLKIRGIGQWTAEIFLIFYLNRPDILPLSDLGFLNAIKRHYGCDSKAEILVIAEVWQPYRTVATWYLWRSLDATIVQY